MVAVVLTQPLPRVLGLVDRVAALGGTPIPLSFSSLRLCADALERLATMDLTPFDRIVFVSPSSVEFAAPVLQRLAATHRARFAAVGAGTAAELCSQLPGIVPIMPPDPPYDADALVALPPMAVSSVGGVLVVRGAAGRDDWLQMYESRGVRIERVALYRNQAESPSSTSVDALQAIVQGAIALPATDGFSVVTSVGIAKALLHWLDAPAAPRGALAGWLRALPCLVSHPRIGSVLRDAGFADTRLPNGHETIGETVVKWVVQRKGE